MTGVALSTRCSGGWSRSLHGFRLILDMNWRYLINADFLPDSVGVAGSARVGLVDAAVACGAWLDEASCRR
ncbi:hypothetical protein D3C84_1233250 [compost metagenome]